MADRIEAGECSAVIAVAVGSEDAHWYAGTHDPAAGALALYVTEDFAMASLRRRMHEFVVNRSPSLVQDPTPVGSTEAS